MVPRTEVRNRQSGDGGRQSMAYYLDLFSPRTHEAFSRSDRTVSGFRENHASRAQRLVQGDKLLCYVTKASRWVGVLEVQDGPFRDPTPRFLETDDPFVIRFHVKPVVWLPLEQGIPMRDSIVWDHLSFTRDCDRASSKWTGYLRGSLAKIPDEDGAYLEELLRRQSSEPVDYPLSDAEGKKLASRPRNGETGRPPTESAALETSDGTPETPVREGEVRESLRIQTLLVKIGMRMGMQVWVPRADREKVKDLLPEGCQALVERLPLNYDDRTLRTIEQIDVLWLKGRTIRRAFEVEHTTAIYSGILRMADLLALQPNMNILLHIVAPAERREKVLTEIQRPAFSVFEAGPLAKRCTFLSYESVEKIAHHEDLPYLSDSVLDDKYVERAGEDVTRATSPRPASEAAGED